MQYLVIFIALTLGGAINAGYLWYSHAKQKPLICPLNHPCDTVTESKWGDILGIRNEILGVFYFAGLFFVAIVPLLNIHPPVFFYDYLTVFTGIGFAFSLFLIGLQKFVIKHYCFYCIISAIISLLIFLDSFALIQFVLRVSK